MQKILRFIFTGLWLFLCLVTFPTSASAASTPVCENLVTNGSFETPVVDYFASEESIEGWRSFNDDIPFEIQSQKIATSSDGSQFLELDSDKVNKIYQDIPTEVDKNYKLTFTFSPRPGVSDNKLNVSWGDTSIVELDKSGESLSDTQWQVYTHNLTANSTTTRLSFDNLNEESNGLGSYIDGITLVASQYATNIIDFSTQYGDSRWSAEQAVGEPNTFEYGDIDTAWTSSSKNGGTEFITLGYDCPIFASGVTVREISGNGFVSKIDVVDTSNVLHTVWQGVDPSQPGSPVDFSISWEPTSFLVKGVKVYVDTQHSTEWEEIDTVELY